ncbi:MAG: hypothetical protein V3V13_13210 [Paracoccaceae bacterium]
MWPKFLPLPSTLLLSGTVALSGYGYITAPKTSSSQSGTEMVSEPVATSDEKPGFERSYKPAVYYQAITERPLFSAERRPISLAPVEVIQEVTEEPEPIEIIPEPEPVIQINFTLHGTMVLNGNNMALIGADEASPVWVKQNALISGWTLREITPEVVKLHRDSDIIELFLYEEDR